MKTKKIRFISTWKTKQAFTLVETVVALFVLSVTCVIVLSSVHTIKTYRTYEENSHDIAWYQFCTEFENQISQEYMEKVDFNVLMTRQEDKYIYYEQYKNMIRRTSSKGGHEPLLLNVQSWNLFQHHDYIIVRIRFENGKIYEHTIYTRQMLKKS
ncbi:MULTISPECIES: competence type IV pilus minor pilin ComGF [unclassified Granulicatella]|uniref:competence type IV pilus minor pilin ComGF n=1 Tax=unclassified Granulicatella TaxID=2630493 RepID=UPI001073B6B5|nr:MULTISPECIES: competence type IV pilus minor pilin ComGF [unclassified Granulicatella]MBF0780556.1 prepilin-type N-terminal cleavage/methylation domain-containing protein [Granulicatella sp. 19428wC4_WM01]TFU94928.1 hypothetical protein E4T68_05545 [Granulicatella sp. WM01]